MVQHGDMQKNLMMEHGNAMARMKGGMHEPGRYNMLHGAASAPGITVGGPRLMGGSGTSFGFGGFREKGGPVAPGKAYVVGEKEPEFFVPDVPGQIVPMYESMGGSSKLTPQFQDIFINTQPRISTAEQLLQAARERLMNAGAAARMKMREQEEQGVRSYVPADPEAVSAELRRRMGVTQGGQAAIIPRFVNAGSVKTIQQRPTGGVIADYGGGNRVVTSRYGTGSATVGGTGKVDELGRPIYTSKAIPKGNTATSERIYEAVKKGGAKGKEKKD